ncbi:AEC family transporter [Aurantimonas sp. HBX-1]|uniref:AEC family transporter n=1 Tax=Aurantimonas sp. HBX-1 TaxID=2906072 RepID=UPI001F4166A2|nr:AEC family transporter [Aurantimonas sp. HBX-1]UIJ73702.1 AEC family transporter [Aurantimonas sp. HBX-1]
MIAIVGLISPFFGLIALGFGAGRIVRHPVEGLAWLNVFIIYIALPALFFQLLAKTPVEKLASPGFVTATTLATFLIFAAGLALALLRSRGDIPASTVQGLASAYGNIGYMGPGLALVALGPEAAIPVALIFCFDNTLHFVMAPLMMALGGDRRGTVLQVAGGVLVRIFTHPFILATIVGVAAAIFHLVLPDPVDRFLQLLANAAAPCALFAMGVTLALRPLKRVPPELAFIVPLKLVAHPLAVWLMLGLFGSFDPVWVQSAMLLASLPTATNVFVIAQQYGVWVERASASVLVTTVLSVGTVTLLLYLIASGAIPADPFP